MKEGWERKRLGKGSPYLISPIRRTILKEVEMTEVRVTVHGLNWYHQSSKPRSILIWHQFRWSQAMGRASPMSWWLSSSTKMPRELTTSSPNYHILTSPEHNQAITPPRARSVTSGTVTMMTNSMKWEKSPRRSFKRGDSQVSASSGKRPSTVRKLDRASAMEEVHARKHWVPVTMVSFPTIIDISGDLV